MVLYKLNALAYSNGVRYHKGQLVRAERANAIRKCNPSVSMTKVVR